MTKPNFFIVGAPKCGTTAIYEYLRTHPGVYLPTTKEPGHFLAGTDLSRIGSAYEDREEYLRLFAAARPDQAAVGEASVWYLFADGALERIRDYDPAARIIMAVRPYAEYLHSLHRQLVFNRWEDEPDFERAWRLQEARGRGQRVPAGCPSPSVLQYKRVGRLGQQLARAMEIFPPDQVRVVRLADLASDPRATYRALLAFLDLDDDGRADFPRVNSNRAYRSEALGSAYQVGALPLRRAWYALKKKLGLGARLRVGPSLVRMISTESPRDALDPAFAAAVRQELEEDAGMLSKIVGADLASYVLGEGGPGRTDTVTKDRVPGR